MESPRMRRIAVVSLKTVICAAILIALAIMLGIRFETGVARAASDPPFDNSGLSVQQSFNADEGFTGPAWYPVTQWTCDQQWVKNPNYTPTNGKPRYVLEKLCHQMQAQVQVVDPPGGAGRDWFPTPSYTPAGADIDPYGVAHRNLCYRGTVKVKVTQHITAGVIDIDTPAVLYWGQYTQKVCSTPDGHIYWASGITPTGDQGAVGEGVGWAGPKTMDTGAKLAAWNDYKSHATLRFWQCVGIPNLGCARVRQRDYVLKGEWIGRNGALLFYPSVNGQAV